MNILALDLGTRTGWAVAEDYGQRARRVESGAQVFDVRRGESPGLRFLRFNRWLLEVVYDRQRYRPALIVYEQPHHRGGAATEIALGFATRVQEFAAQYGIQHAAVHSATLKKWTTGKGNAKKPEMHAAVERRWGVKAATDDEADAVALLYYAVETWGGT